MKLKFFIAGLAVVAGLASAVSCQDLTKDLTDLKSKVASLESTVQALQSKIDAGAVITSVTPSNSGILITLSNGNKYEITNGVNGKDGANGKDGKDGKDGTPGSVVTIGDNGNWFIDGVDTGLAAQGEDGEDGTPGAFFVPDPETGCFVMFVWDPEKEEYVGVPTEIPFVAEGTLTAVYNPLTGVVTLFGIEGYEGGYEIGGHSAEGVTSVEVYGYQTWTGADDLFTVVEKTNTFGPNKEMTFTDGTKVDRPISYLLNVTPASAQISEEDIALINSKGEAFTNLEVVSVEPYDGYITKADGDYGVWKVTVKLTKYDEKEFDAAAYDEDGNNISYAFKVGDAITNYVIAYDHQDYYPANALTGTVNGVAAAAYRITANGTPISGIKNRAAANIPDYVWRPYSKKYPTPTIEQKTAKQDPTGYTVIDGDNRTLLPYLTTSVGKAIKIEAPTALYKAMYVALDKAHANALDPSELAAWESYDIAGLDVLSETGVINLNIKSKNADGDVIGFRLFAVNWDGTFADPDGMGFYVILGENSSDTWDAVETVVTPKNAGDYGIASALAPVKASALPTAASWALIMDDLTAPTFNIAGFYKSDKKTALTYANPTWKDVAYITTVPTEPVAGLAVTGYQMYADEETYTGTVTIYDANDFVLATFPVSFTKSLKGLAAPAGFAIKEGMLNPDKSYYIYQGSANGAAANVAYKAAQKATEETAKKAAATIGTAAEAAFLGNELPGEVVPFDLADFYKFGSIPAADQANFITSIAGAGRILAYDAATDTETDWTAAGDYIALDGTATNYYATPIYGSGVNLYYDVNGAQFGTAILPASIVDNKAHAVSVFYDFGQISAELDNNNIVVPVPDDVVIPVESFNVYFCSTMGKAAWAFDWDLWSTANVTVAGDVLPGSGVTAAGQNWHSVAPTHNARINYNAVAGILKYDTVAAWTPSKIDATNYALWSTDPFTVDAPIVIELGSGTTAGEVEIASTTIFGKSEKTGAAYNQSLNNALTVTDAIYIPADHAGVAANWNLAIGGFEKAGTTYRSAKLSNEDYFVAKYGVTYTSGNPIPANSFGLDKVATAANPSVKVNMTCTVTAFDAFANKVTFTVPVQLVPAP